MLRLTKWHPKPTKKSRLFENTCKNSPKKRVAIPASCVDHINNLSAAWRLFANKAWIRLEILIKAACYRNPACRNRRRGWPLRDKWPDATSQFPFEFKQISNDFGYRNCINTNAIKYIHFRLDFKIKAELFPCRTFWNKESYWRQNKTVLVICKYYPSNFISYSFNCLVKMIPRLWDK